MERSFSAHEALMVGSGMRVVAVSEIDGELDEGTLEYAARHLADRHPILRGAFTGEPGFPRLTVPDPGARATAGSRSEPATPYLHRVADLSGELDAPTRWDTGPLFRIALVREGGAAGANTATGRNAANYVVMTMPRACVDGMSYLALLREFWSTYTEACAGRKSPAVPVQPILPPPLDDIILDKYSQADLQAYVEGRAKEDALNPPAHLPTPAAVGTSPGPTAEFDSIRVGLDASETNRLADAARARSLSLNSLMCGILATAMRPALEPAAGTVTVTCALAADLRRRLTPPIPDDRVQSAASGCPIRLDVDADPDPFQVAAQMSERLRDNLQAGNAEREIAAFSRLVDHCPPTFVVTNLGRVPRPPLPGHNRFVSLRLLPLAHMPVPFVVLTRLEGGLDIDFPFSRAWYDERQIDEIAAEARRVIAGITA
ncbi:condensation domain-containing protein [Yinghuangia sp. ASG 101]|uniref:phthiocerol/phthiodiolone dimycocerosyl transferase family protein n=1 Tax=Yinghuangia sp. ASG 101 TaxID=2896848 RepID=UPI001E4FDA5A|nr:condensation domain-containing protein [Yinghuangia sp. ASG 101]UGQ12644.1 condensation domain-containing protein [Yinghuangia sp. ASG 101]